MKLGQLLEVKKPHKTKSLLGTMINGKAITDKTKTKVWAGDFICSNNYLTSLEYAPTSVKGSFFCSNNYLASLEFAPVTVGDNFRCDNNELSSLKYAPLTVNGYFSCEHNQLTSLEHAPRIIKSFFSCSGNQLTSLHNVHKIIKEMKGSFYCIDNPIVKQILGILLINGCAGFVFRDDIDRIVNRYLPNTQGLAAVDECQNELIEAGLEEYAEL